jgi:hypothetical protein
MLLYEVKYVVITITNSQQDRHYFSSKTILINVKDYTDLFLLMYEIIP